MTNRERHHHEPATIQVLAAAAGILALYGARVARVLAGRKGGRK